MEQRKLGSMGRRVSAIGLGTMPLAIQNRPSEAEAVKVIHAALATGIDWLDTADSYCLDTTDVGYAERLVAKALNEWSGARDTILVTTKAGYVRPNGAWNVDVHPARIKAACEASLKALGVSSLGLYQLHGVDPKLYYPDCVGALARLKQEGKIQHVGLCNVDAGHIRDACRVVEVASVQNRCNLFDAHCFANGVVELCEQRGIAFIAHSPVGGHQGHVRVANDPTLNAIARRHDRTPQQIALAWLLARSPSLLAIPGATRSASVEGSARAPEIRLAASDLADLERAFPTPNLLLQRLVRVRTRVRHAVRTVKTFARRN